MTNRPTLSPVHAIAGLIVALLAVLAAPGSAAAHTDFVSSTPADGSTVIGPLSTVTVEFTNPAVESGDGFELLGPDGVVRVPDALDPTDGTRFVATFDPPLPAGVYGFRWDVQAGDAHPIQGSFQFTVEAPPTTTEPGAVTTASGTDPTTPVAPGEQTATDGTTNGAGNGATGTAALEPPRPRAAGQVRDLQVLSAALEGRDAQTALVSIEAAAHDDVDHPGHRIGAIQGRGAVEQNIDPLHRG